MDTFYNSTLDEDPEVIKAIEAFKNMETAPQAQGAYSGKGGAFDYLESLAGRNVDQGPPAVTPKPVAAVPTSSPVIEPEIAAAAARIGGAGPGNLSTGGEPYPWKDIGELDQGFDIPREPARQLARGGPQLDEAPIGHKEPYEKNAEMATAEQARAGKLSTLRGLQDVAEGLASIRFTTPGHILHKVEHAPTYKAESLRSAIKTQEGKLSPADVAFFQSMGIDANEDMDYNRFAKFLSELGNRRKREELKAVAATKEAGRKTRFDASQGRLKEQQDKANKTKIVDKFNQFTKQANDDIYAVSKIKDLIASKDAQAIKNAIIPMARLLGEKGALSDLDRAEIKKRLGVFNRVEDWAASNLAGKMSDEFVASLNKMVDIADKAARGIKRIKAKEVASQYSKSFDLDPKEVEEMLIGDDAEAPHAGSSEVSSSGGQTQQYKPGDKIIGPDGKTHTIRSVLPDGRLDTD